MAYVRRRGSQLAIVHGRRDPQTRKVEQRILFTLYSKAEALEALGRRGGGGVGRFRHLLEDEYPDIRFDWRKIRDGISANLDALPDLYDYRTTRLRTRFRKDLSAFVKHLILTDPQEVLPAAQLIQEQRHELEYLADLIQWRLEFCEQAESQWNRDNSFYWRFAMRGSAVPPDTEEHAAELYRCGEYDRAEAVFRLLIECFDNYAEGHNYLGLIAHEQGRNEEAITQFEKTVEIGRRLFPKRMARKHYWSDLSTRPYIRGLRNLALTLNEVGEYERAIALCERLDHECGDDITATSIRAAIYLNTGRWQAAAAAARELHRLIPAEDLVASFALFELGRREDAVAAFLHGALNHPRAARMLMGEDLPEPKTSYEVEDHNVGVGLWRSLRGHRMAQSRASKRCFRALCRDPRVRALLDEMAASVRSWNRERGTGERKAFDRMQHMRTPEFARDRAKEIADDQEGKEEPSQQAASLGRCAEEVSSQPCAGPDGT